MRRLWKLPAVSALLWRERDLLGQVVDELEDPERPEPVPVATVLADLEVVQQERRLIVDRAGVALGLPAGCTLADLAGAAPEPWDDLLRHHISGLLKATREIVAAAATGGPAQRESA